MPNIKLVLEYNGAAFHGWQKQPGLKTVEGELHRVLELVLKEKLDAVYGSGRTDAGVHARSQVANFYCQSLPDLDRLRQAISGILRPDLAVLSAEIVPESFGARRSSISKQYSYLILHRASPAVLDYGRAWHISRKLDLEKMQQEAKALIGQHDFTSLRAASCEAPSPIKKIFESEMLIDPPYLIYRVVGEGFLKHMVRNIVGTLVGLGDGFLDLKSMAEILMVRDRRQAGVTAPAHGLYLDWVEY